MSKGYGELRSGYKCQELDDMALQEEDTWRIRGCATKNDTKKGIKEPWHLETRRLDLYIGGVSIWSARYPIFQDSNGGNCALEVCSEYGREREQTEKLTTVWRVRVRAPIIRRLAPIPEFPRSLRRHQDCPQLQRRSMLAKRH